MRVNAVFAVGLLGTLCLTGCFVSTKKGGNGEDVDIRTPLGGMTVKTDAANVTAKVGLPLYPGATPEKKDGKDNGSADVDMNFGPFHLRVLALAFSSPDSEAQVGAYYRKALAQYSDVIECRGGKPVNGSAAKTGLGLTCSEDKHVHVNGNDRVKISGTETELKSGSPSRQHIVGIKTENGRTQFGLIALELPKDGKDDTNDEPN